ncbi:MAG: helix-hairpin-helix domain-containing protein [Ginsengibacter sp.]
MKSNKCTQPLSRFLITLLLLCIVAQDAGAQVKPSDPNEPPAIIEQQLENLTEASEDVVTEDDSYLQELFHYTKEPLNLNYASEGQLQELTLLSAIQIANLILYRKTLGNFINIYELQAIPGWDITLLRRIKPYIAVNRKPAVVNSLRERLKKGRNALLVRGTQVLEKSKGYLLDSSLATNFYPGSAQKILMRYKYQFKNLLQYGLTAEKDAGEQFFKGAQKDGFDFYSAHFFLRNLGIVKSLAVGDFTVNLGQGLTQWQSLAFKKSSAVMNIKRQSDVLKPYNSAGEIAFNRGLGITLTKNKWETTGFISYRKLDANFNADTVGPGGIVSSLQNSGYHRTAGEVEDKNVQTQLSFGGNIGYSSSRAHIGINGVHYGFSHNITKTPYLYNAYALSGKSTGNYSVDYSYTYKNLHFFGEAAVDEGRDKAFINGLLISVDSRVDMSFLYRHISRGYQTLYASAFTENTFPTNESGFYSGISITPVDYLRIDAYADFYHFPWVKYRLDAPSSGNDYMIQLTYKPNKLLEMYTRYHTERKPINYNPNGTTLNPPIVQPKQFLRTQFSYKLSSTFILRSRVEISWFDKKGEASQSGFLYYCDIIFKPLLKPLSGSVRLQYFETGGYDSRLYAYENDVLYSYSIPVFYDKGYRYYLNITYDLNKKTSIWARFAQTAYPGKSLIGSGLDAINGHLKTEIKLQFIVLF